MDCGRRTARLRDKLSNHEVDMIICDVMLPDINGWELCTRIKSDLRFNHIPVIILTAKNGIDDRIAVMMPERMVILQSHLK